VYYILLIPPIFGVRYSSLKRKGEWHPAIAFGVRARKKLEKLSICCDVFRTKRVAPTLGPYLTGTLLVRDPGPRVGTCAQWALSTPSVSPSVMESAPERGRKGCNCEWAKVQLTKGDMMAGRVGPKLWNGAITAAAQLPSRACLDPFLVLPLEFHCFCSLKAQRTVN